MKYLLETTATMKSYNNKKWWIDSGIIPPVTIKADAIEDALIQYRTIAADKCGVNITNNAIHRKNEMFVDTKSGETVQTGYVITASTEFDNGNNNWIKQYIDLWITINIVTNPFMEE